MLSSQATLKNLVCCCLITLCHTQVRRLRTVGTVPLKLEVRGLSYIVFSYSEQFQIADKINVQTEAAKPVYENSVQNVVV